MYVYSWYRVCSSLTPLNHDVAHSHNHFNLIWAWKKKEIIFKNRSLYWLSRVIFVLVQNVAGFFFSSEANYQLDFFFLTWIPLISRLPKNIRGNLLALIEDIFHLDLFHSFSFLYFFYHSEVSTEFYFSIGNFSSIFPWLKTEFHLHNYCHWSNTQQIWCNRIWDVDFKQYQILQKNSCFFFFATFSMSDSFWNA